MHLCLIHETLISSPYLFEKKTYITNSITRQIHNYQYTGKNVCVLGMSVLCKYVTAAYFAYCCIFQQSAHIAHFFHIIWHFRWQF